MEGAQEEPQDEEEEVSEEMRRHLAYVYTISTTAEARNTFPSDDERAKYFEYISSIISCCLFVYDSSDALPVEDETVRYVEVSETKFRILNDSHVGGVRVGRVSKYCNVPFDGLPMERLISDFHFDVNAHFLLKIIVTDGNSNAVINHLAILPQDPVAVYGARKWSRIKAANANVDLRSNLSFGVGDPNTCAACKKTGTKLRHCGACKIVWYCGPECQRANWNVHKLECKRISGPHVGGERSSGAGGSNASPS